LVWDWPSSRSSWQAWDISHFFCQEVVAVALAISFPVNLFPFSRTVWIATDLMLHPSGQAAERQLQGIWPTATGTSLA
jgi:hypothetical protein